MADVMRELGVQSVPPLAYRVTTTPRKGGDCPSYLLDPECTDSTAARMVEDTTSLRTTHGWLDLATVIDMATHIVVQWQVTDYMCTSRVSNALGMARPQGQL